VPTWSHPTHGPRNSFARPCWNSDAASGALPYRFSLVVWGSGTIITRSRGTPHVGDVFLGALGVVIGYGALQFLGRLAPARNNQKIGVTMADDYRLGAVAQLGERLAGSQKVRGSSPLSSTGPKAA
jgi:hypothetical protein